VDGARRAEAVWTNEPEAGHRGAVLGLAPPLEQGQAPRTPCPPHRQRVAPAVAAPPVELRHPAVPDLPCAAGCRASDPEAASGTNRRAGWLVMTWRPARAPDARPVRAASPTRETTDPTWPRSTACAGCVARGSWPPRPGGTRCPRSARPA